MLSVRSGTLPKLGAIWTACPLNSPGFPAITEKALLDEPGAIGPKFPGVTPLPVSRFGSMLPPLFVWIAPRNDGFADVPWLAIWKVVDSPAWTMPRLRVGVAVLPPVTLAPVITSIFAGFGPAARIWPVPETLASLLKLLPVPKFAFV